MERPEKTEMFKVTEREAGTGRIVPAGALGADAEGDASTAGEPEDALGAPAVVVAAAKTPAVVEREHAESMRGLCGNDQVMPAVEAVRLHPVYIDHAKRIERAEAERRFCRHQIDHLLDVARIAYIRLLERRMPFRKETVYAAALLHDIGKAEQYETGEPHEVAGARVAAQILTEVEGFSALEKTAIVAAVAQHRRYDENASPLGKLLFEADKASRPCFACPARKECDWPDEQKNAGVKI